MFNSVLMGLIFTAFFTLTTLLGRAFVFYLGMADPAFLLLPPDFLVSIPSGVVMFTAVGEHLRRR